MPQHIGLLGRHGVPSPQPGVADALLRIGGIGQHAPGDGPAITLIDERSLDNDEFTAGISHYIVFPKDKYPKYDYVITLLDTNLEYEIKPY